MKKTLCCLINLKNDAGLIIRCSIPVSSMSDHWLATLNLSNHIVFLLVLGGEGGRGGGGVGITYSLQNLIPLCLPEFLNPLL